MRCCIRRDGNLHLERCLGIKTINDIIDDIMLLDDYKLNDRQDIENVVVDFINDLLRQELIELV